MTTGAFLPLNMCLLFNLGLRAVSHVTRGHPDGVVVLCGVALKGVHAFAAHCATVTAELTLTYICVQYIHPEHDICLSVRKCCWAKGYD